MSDRLTHRCMQCNETWQSLVPLPKQCAKCGTRNWTTKKPQMLEDMGMFVLTERIPYGKACFLFYQKGSASGGHHKLGGYYGVSAQADSLPKKAKIAILHKYEDEDD